MLFANWNFLPLLMRVLLQRVSEASVSLEGKLHSQIQKGLLVLLGIEEADGDEDISWLANKIINLRIFADEQGLMNKSLIDCGGELLVVSQFTLHADSKKGNRPSYIRAAKPPISIPLYEAFLKETERLLGKPVAAGVFGANMQVALINDGPVSIWIDSKNKDY